MKKLTLTLGSLLFAATCTWAQSFQTTLFDVDRDHNHYSIETARNSDYLIAGTKFDSSASSAGDRTMHVVRMNSSGVVQWEVTINQSQDDRALDIAEDRYGDILVCGLMTHNGYEQFYVLKLDAFGNQLGRVLLDFNAPSVATNIIYSYDQDAYFVGGFYADSIAFQLTNNRAIMVRLETNLNLTWINTFAGNDEMHSAINDIVELPGGLFVTGSIDFQDFWSATYQGVLAMFLDPTNGGITSDLSFHSTNYEHVGVSAIYEDSTDRVYLMSNNSVVHNPQITIITGATSTPAIAFDYILELDSNYGPINAAGFELRPSIFDTNNLVASGYFRTYDLGAAPFNNATCWTSEFRKNTGTDVLTLLYDAPSTDFHAHGDGGLSTFQGEHPYVYNQEILTWRADGGGYVMVAPRLESGVFAVDILSTAFQYGLNPCMPDFPLDTLPITYDNISVYDMPHQPNSDSIGHPDPYNTETSSFCYEEWDGSLKNTREQAMDVNAQYLDGAFQMFPNPTHGSVQLTFNHKDLDGQLYVCNAMGEVITQVRIAGDFPSTEVNLSSHPAGIYFVRFEDTVKKVVKH